MKNILILLTFVGLATGQAVNIQLAAKDLDSGDAMWGPPDPFIKVNYAMGNNAWTFVGKTSTLHTHNPEWKEIFNFQYVEALDQYLQFEIHEDDVFDDDKYGTVVVSMSDVMKAPNNILTRDFVKGILIIKKV